MVSRRPGGKRFPENKRPDVIHLDDCYCIKCGWIKAKRTAKAKNRNGINFTCPSCKKRRYNNYHSKPEGSK